MQCSIPDCGEKATARGLCPKHYMRKRRHGDANIIQRRGPKTDEQWLSTLAQFLLDTASTRTHSRMAAVFRLRNMLWDLGDDRDFIKQAVIDTTRKNGTLNVARLLETMERRLASVIIRADDPGPAPPRKVSNE
jgi:hypothetical protein